jgi:hypothetical protein
MKKTKALVFIFICFSVASCKKDRTCECINTSTFTSSAGSIYTISPGNGNYTTTTTVVYKNIKKSDMKSLCGDNKSICTSEGYNTNGNTTTITQVVDSKCKLK